MMLNVTNATKTGHYANECPEIKAKNTKGSLKVRKMDESITKDDAETKAVCQIRVRISDAYIYD